MYPDLPALRIGIEYRLKNQGIEPKDFLVSVIDSMNSMDRQLDWIAERQVGLPVSRPSSM